MFDEQRVGANHTAPEQPLILAASSTDRCTAFKAGPRRLAGGRGALLPGHRHQIVGRPSARLPHACKKLLRCFNPPPDETGRHNHPVHLVDEGRLDRGRFRPGRGTLLRTGPRGTVILIRVALTVAAGGTRDSLIGTPGVVRPTKSAHDRPPLPEFLPGDELARIVFRFAHALAHCGPC